MNFGLPPEDLDYSIPMEPMRIGLMGEEQEALKEFLTFLVDTHPTKLTKKQKDELRSVYRQILLNVIYNSIRSIYSAVPRGVGAFAKGSYWNRLGLTYRFTISALDRLEAEGYIYQFKGVPWYEAGEGLGKLTRIYGADLLAQKIDVERVREEIVFEGVLDDRDELELKDFGYPASAIDEDHPDRQRLTAINKFLDGFNWQQKGPMRLIYKGSPMHGGRVYSRFQNMPRLHRKGMLISGKPTVELDFKANHLSMLIASQGLPIPADPYTDIAVKTELSRDQVKKFVTASLGASSEDSAFAALKKDRFNKLLFNKVRDALLQLFPGVPLFRGFGTVLQSLEGQIALDIMHQGVIDGVVVLPVHDSFITTLENKEWLWRQMTEKWASHVKDGAVPWIEEK
jgi:hypothetical protein